MGICTSKKDYEKVELPSIQLPPGPSAKRKILQQLIDLNKARKVPLLSLAHNSLYRQRVEGLRKLDNWAEDLNQLQTVDLKISCLGTE